MDIYFKALGAAMISLVLILTLSGTGKDYGILLMILASCLIICASFAFLSPVVVFFQDLTSMIHLDSELFSILLKTVGISMVGQIAALICADCGQAALGKTLQLMTNILILWLTLPLLQAMLDLIKEILEGL